MDATRRMHVRNDIYVSKASGTEQVVETQIWVFWFFCLCVFGGFFW